MSASQRQQAILQILFERKSETCLNLANEFGVTKRTILSDIEALTCSYPIETVRGRYGGGVRLMDGYSPRRNTLTSKQLHALKVAQQYMSGDDLQAINSIIQQFGT